MIFESVKFADLTRDLAPYPVRHICFTPRKRDHANVRQVVCRRQFTEDLSSVFWVCGQEPKSDEIMSFTTAHGLRKLKYCLLRFLLKTPKRLHEKCPHTVGDVVLFEKGIPVNFVVNQVSEIEDGITLRGVEDAISRRAQLFKRFHRQLPFGK